MIKPLICAIAAAVLLPSVALADASLVGDWSSTEGETHGTKAGTPDHSGAPPGKNLHGLGGVWTLKIQELEGRGFHGQWCGPGLCEELAGVLHGAAGLYAVDEDGIFIGERRGEVIDLCYLEPGKTFRIASCRELRKN